MDKSYKNSGLFSDHYLSDKLPNIAVWQLEPSELVKAHDKIKTLYQTKKDELPNLSESALEERFIRPILRALGHVYEVQPTLTATAEGMKKPDYAFFENEEARGKAEKISGKEEFFKRSIAIGEAKPWERPLDKKLKSEKDPFEIQNPSLQMSRYLWLTGTKWGILTNGRLWRLYERETSKRIDIYYEIDLPALLEQGTAEDFKYFYLFFSKNAFIRDTEGLCFLDGVYQGSVDYREAVSEELKERIYQALRVLANGFLQNPANHLSEDSLQEIHDNSLILLYRLLFILYAEHRHLLPLDNPVYKDTYSLYAQKREIAGKIDTNAPLSQTMNHYHGKLKELFEVVNIGNEELGVPPYNGGLFDPLKHEFLEKYRVGDAYLASVIDLLSRTRDKAYVDYSSLEIRHLGSIYEGLLEYKLRIADEDMVAIKDKTEVWVSTSEVKGNPVVGDKVEYKKKNYRVLDAAPKGLLYLTTDRGERKATGSYYTPDYIVKYIVENTVGPLINEKKQLVYQKVQNLGKKVKESRGYNREQYEKQLREAENSLVDEVLSLKVLDPAMGSGHFLVEATDYIARALVGVLSGELFPEEETVKIVSEAKETAPTYGFETEDEEDIHWARREVIERCIFGVDLNPLAVELAKLSLWLSTVAKDRPLSFLDHHLRCGNSLIGVKVDDLSNLPEISKKKKKAKVASVQASLFEPIFKEKVNLMLRSFALLEKLPSDTVEQIREKEKYYEEFRRHVQRFKEIADIWTSTYFGNEVPYDGYVNLQMNLRAQEEEWERWRSAPWFENAVQIADDKEFFHWELEFPEIFFEGHQRKENPGFDVVMGNPPYGYLSNKIDRHYFKKTFSTAQGEIDFFILFYEKAFELTKKKGKGGFITPDTWLTLRSSEPLRKLATSTVNPIEFADLYKPFEDSKDTRCHIFLFGKQVNDAAFIKVSSTDNPPKSFSDIVSLQANEWKIKELARLVESGWPLYQNHTLRSIFGKMIASTLELKSIAKVKYGLRTGDNKRFVSDSPKEGSETKLLSGADLTRYFIDWNPKYLIGQESLPKSYFRSEIVNQNKVAIQYVRTNNTDPEARWLEAALSEFPCICLNSLSFILSDRVNSAFILSLVNSYLMNKFYRANYTDVNVKTMYLEQLPIPHISFVTTPKEREQGVEKAKVLYDAYLELGNRDEILNFVAALLERKHKPDPKLVEKSNSDPLNRDFQIPLGALWEQSDVVHDILAFLAEQMIEMNKEKQAETKGFLEWLEREIGAKIDDLTNKTKVKAYHEHSFDDLLDVLKQNRNKLKANLSSRDFQKNLETEFEKSLTKLTPLKSKIQSTDDLIDQIVYKLYGLTEEEIKIIEEKT